MGTFGTVFALDLAAAVFCTGHLAEQPHNSLSLFSSIGLPAAGV